MKLTYKKLINVLNFYPTCILSRKLPPLTVVGGCYIIDPVCACSTASNQPKLDIMIGSSAVAERPREKNKLHK